MLTVNDDVLDGDDDDDNGPRLRVVYFVLCFFYWIVPLPFMYTSQC